VPSNNVHAQPTGDPTFVPPSGVPSFVPSNSMQNLPAPGTKYLLLEHQVLILQVLIKETEKK
jgi:hypothetical protein